MGNSYQRQDVSNNIANGNIINADDLDAEFNALEGAFTAVTGHSHDGTAGEGGPISQVGPAQDLIVSASQVLPKTDNTLDLGSTSFEFKDLWIDGIANIDSLVADTADINGGTVDNAIIGGTTPAAGTFTSVVATTADINAGTIDNTVIGGATPAAGTFTAVTATTADINGGTVDATVIGGATPAAGTFTTATATSGVVNANSSSAALRVTQIGTGPALLVEDSSNPDSTPFIVAADGAVAIGTLTTPSYANFGSLTMDGTQGSGIDLRRAGALEGEIFLANTGKLTFNSAGAAAEFRVNMNGTNRFKIDPNGNAALNGAFSVLAGDTVFAINSDTQDSNLRLRYLDSTVAAFRTQTNVSAYLGTDIAVPMRLGSNNTTVIRLGGTTQNVSIGRGNADGDAAAVVDIGGTTKGLLIPRLSTTQRNAIASVPTGLLVYNTTLNQLEHFNGSVWGPVGISSGTLTTTDFAAATLVTAAEGIGSNNNDTTIPTSAAVKAYADTNPIASATVVASTSGTIVEFTGIPSWAKRVTVIFNGVSLSGASNFLVQLGAGSYVTSGYSSGSSGTNNSNTSSTTGMVMAIGTASANLTGHMVITLLNTTNTWVSSHQAAINLPGPGVVGGASLALGGTLDRIRITSVSGTDTFDAGAINIMWE